MLSSPLTSSCHGEIRCLQESIVTLRKATDACGPDFLLGDLPVLPGRFPGSILTSSSASQK